MITKMQNFADFRGYVLYIYDSEKLEGKLYPLPRITPTLRIKETAEIFSLDFPAFYIEGKPVFFVFRGYPLTIGFDFKTAFKIGYWCDECSKMFNPNDKEIVEFNNSLICGLCGKKLDKIEFKPHLAEKSYSASEIDAKVTSIYTNRMFRQSAITTNVVIAFILSIIVAILITFITMNTIYQAKIDFINEVVTPTISMVKMLGGFLYF